MFLKVHTPVRECQDQRSYSRNKVSGPNLILNQTSLIEWCVVTCELKKAHQKDVFERDWTTYSKFVNYSRFNRQHNWGTYMIIQTSSRNNEENGYGLDLDLLIILY